MSGTVLVIDDSPELLAVVAARLKPEGYRVLTSPDWQFGLEQAVTEQPDLVLLDVDMPDQSGLDVCRRLKSDPRTSAIPVIFLTAHDDVNVKVHGFDLGASDYITKPFHPAELRARVRSAIRTKLAIEDLDEQARVDALTGLFNRREFDRLLAANTARALRENRNLSLVIVDLDHFKSLNDRFGHAFGDLVLRSVGALIARSVRTGDAACRYGGEEIALILPNASSSSAVDVANRIRQGLRSLAFLPKGDAVVVTASFGVADLSDIGAIGSGMAQVALGSLGQALTEAADQALYAAKREGRDRVTQFAAAGVAAAIVPAAVDQSARRAG
jgi:diguanylate cyclase (GGDEF)-like protein